jgi:hypothetical protein
LPDAKDGFTRSAEGKEKMQPTFRPVAALDLLLNRDNPRHVSKENQEEVIEYLLADEEVYNLARHMAHNGINPLEVVAAFPDEDGNLVVAEGNRRVCAAQLLTDPQKAPEAARARFKALSAKGRDVSEFNVAEFPDYETARPWLQVLHDGEQDGVGRRRWKPEQKARATTSKSTDALAVALLDYAEREGIISAEMRRDILVSTATRYLANPTVRAAMGITSTATSDKIAINTDPQRFAKILAHFFEGIISRRLHSRSVTAEWLQFASELEATFGTPNVTTPAVQVNSVATTERPRVVRSTRVRIATPETRYISRSAPIIETLNRLGSFKLSSLYNSLTSLRLDEHPALLTAGAWMFVETLCALHGKDSHIEFVGYLNGKFGTWNIGKDQGKECRLSLEYISHNGNAQKHSAIFSAIDARNLHNHFQVLEPVFVAALQECADKKQGKK